ncbi:MAG: hypothetical protein H7321_02535 [Bacteroidia bacterium]|nr:hypothetical protein [Bacteroidia bacterium]
MDSKSTLMGDTQGMSYFQLGTIAMQKGNMKDARVNLKEAIRIGMPEKDNMAAAYLQLASIEIQRRQYRTAKEYFKKAKDKKPKADELKSQIAEMEKYISRMPG